MPPKAMSQADIERLITQRVNAAMEAERALGEKLNLLAATLQGRALTWWNSQVATRGLEAANQIGWTEMKRLMTEEFCPIEEIYANGSNEL
ncbi:hypothetical protein Tco_0110654 [Tanacetum coccineum]